MTAKEYCRRLAEAASRRADARYDEFPLHHACGVFSFPRLASKDIAGGDRIVLVRAGIHGEEISGPLAALHHLDRIFDGLHRRGLKAVIYPLGNPSGFERGSRRDGDDDGGEAGNNDFLRYRLADGTMKDDLGEGTEFQEWFWSSDPTLKAKLPVETRLMHERLKQEPLKQVVACLDWHQDHAPGLPAGAYQYVVGDRGRYRAILDRIRRVTPLLANTPIGLSPNDPNCLKIIADENGCLTRYDGTLTDLFWRLGVRETVTIETTAAVPLEKAEEVNLIWLEGVADLVS